RCRVSSPCRALCLSSPVTSLRPCMPRPLSSFSSATRPPPPSTPFPYTTLFRSPPGQAGVGQRCLGLLPQRVHHGERGPLPTDLLDRKSTRLNSSHVSISYAVFCLKKKTTSAPEQWASCARREGVGASQQ